MANTLFETQLPTFKYKKQELSLFPKPSTIKIMSAEEGAACDAKLLFKMVNVARETRGKNLDAIRDRHDGIMLDGMSTKGQAFEGFTFLFGELGTCSAMLTAMVEETKKAKSDAVVMIYERLLQFGKRLVDAGVEVPTLVSTDSTDIFDVLTAANIPADVYVYSGSVKRPADVVAEWIELVERNMNKYRTSQEKSSKARTKRWKSLERMLMSKDSTTLYVVAGKDAIQGKLIAFVAFSTEVSRPPNAADHAAGDAADN